MRLVLASRNPNKLVELRALCGLEDSFLVSAAECPGAPDPEEDGATFVENALIKARALRDAVEGPMSHYCTLSGMQNHPAGTIVCDEAAVGELKVSSYRYFKAVEAAENRL